MNPKKLLCTIGLAGILSAGFSIAAFAVNPYMPLWEHVADAEPHVFTDPETGEERVYGMDHMISIKQNIVVIIT